MSYVKSEQSDWMGMLNSVLFSIRCQVQTSMGYSVIRMLYNKDPLMPFEYAAKLQVLGEDSIQSGDESVCLIQNSDEKIDYDPVSQQVKNWKITDLQYLIELNPEFKKHKSTIPNIIIYKMVSKVRHHLK